MQTTEAIKRRITELEEQRKAISKEIRQLKTTVWQREHYKPSVNENSLVRQSFWKICIRTEKYDAMRQAETRKRKSVLKFIQTYREDND